MQTDNEEKKLDGFPQFIKMLREYVEGIERFANSPDVRQLVSDFEAYKGKLEHLSIESSIQRIAEDAAKKRKP